MGDCRKYFLCLFVAAATALVMPSASVHAKGSKTGPQSSKTVDSATVERPRGGLLTDKDVGEIVAVFERADNTKIGPDQKISIIDCIQIVCRRVGLPPERLIAIGHKETRLSPDARENDGAKGMLQLKDERFIDQVACHGWELRDILAELAPQTARRLEQVLPKIPYVPDPQDPDKKIFVSSKLKLPVRKEILSLRRSGKTHDNVIVETAFVAQDLRARRDLVGQKVKGFIPSGGAVLHSLHRFGEPGATIEALTRHRGKVERTDRRYAEISSMYRQLLEEKQKRLNEQQKEEREKQAKTGEERVLRPFPQPAITPNKGSLTLH